MTAIPDDDTLPAYRPMFLTALATILFLVCTLGGCRSRWRSRRANGARAITCWNRSCGICAGRCGMSEFLTFPGDNRIGKQGERE